MSSRSIFRAAAACAVLAISISAPAEAQLGRLRRAAERVVPGAAQQAPAVANPVSQPASASSSVNTGDVLEMTAPVLDRFQRALEAEATDLAQLAQRLDSLKTPEEFGQCQVDWYNSPAGQAAYAKLTAASDSGDYARITAVGTEIKTAMDLACGDPLAGERIRQEAPAHAEQAALAAGGFASSREYAVMKERVIPFCRASAATAGQGEVRLPGDGTNIFWVYTAAEATALRERCGALMQALSQTS